MDLSDKLAHGWPNAEWNIPGKIADEPEADEYDRLQWYGPGEKPERGEIEAIIIVPKLPPLTARQLRLGLIAAGISLSSVEAAIAGIEDATDREIARVEWEYALQFDRDHPLIDQVGVALGLTPEQIDAAWLAAINL